MSQKWNERYDVNEYIFGTEPNDFLKRVLPQLPQGGRALDLATGEGRNGIFLAQHGFEAEGVDSSAVGLQKAQRMAAEKGVHYSTREGDITTMLFAENYYDVISSVFCHFAEPIRSQLLAKIVRSLKIGGMFVGVFYHPDQLSLGTGGPKDPAMLASSVQLAQSFKGMEWLIAEDVVRDVHEGNRHRGRSAVVYLLGKRVA